MRAIAEIRIRLRKEDVMAIDYTDKHPCLAVNGEGIYYLPQSLYVLRRGVLGTVILIPSTYPQSYVFENGSYQDARRRR